jgi:hypothetical protein
VLKPQEPLSGHGTDLPAASKTYSTQNAGNATSAHLNSFPIKMHCKATTIKVSNPSQVQVFRTDLGGKWLFLAAFFMRQTDGTPRTETKPASTGLGGLANYLPISHLPIAPFKAWSRPGMKTGLRNQLIGRKLSLVPFRVPEIDKTPTQLAKSARLSRIL